MSEKQSTYGDFIESVEKTENFEAGVFISQWIELATAEQWKEYSSMPLTAELVIGFAQDMALHFQQRISDISTEGLYSLTVKSGHEFLQEVHQKAIELGVDVELNQIDTPLTMSESLAAVGLVKLVKSKG